MSKEKTTSILKKRVSQNNVDTTLSLFSDTDYEFNRPAEQSEFDKIYKGKSSDLDQVSVDTEYSKPKHKKSNM